MTHSPRQRARWLFASAGACLGVVGLLILFAWLEVTLTPPQQCARETCGDVWLFPVFVGPWFLFGAIGLAIAGVSALRQRQGPVGTSRPPVTPAFSVESPFHTAPGNPGLRIVGGLIDLIVISIAYEIFVGIFVGIGHTLTGTDGSAVDAVNALASLLGVIGPLAYFVLFWCQRGQSVGMMPFKLRVRDQTTGGYPPPGRALVRAFVWLLEAFGTAFLIGAIGWLWMFRDPRGQAIHDKAAGTIVTADRAGTAG